MQEGTRSCFLKHSIYSNMCEDDEEEKRGLNKLLSNCILFKQEAFLCFHIYSPPYIFPAKSSTSERVFVDTTSKTTSRRVFPTVLSSTESLVCVFPYFAKCSSGMIQFAEFSQRVNKCAWFISLFHIFHPPSVCVCLFTQLF